MKYCMECGNKLILKEVPHEGSIPYCTRCNHLYFHRYNCAISLIVRDEKHILLIKQYGKDAYILVAGYINPNESVEAGLKRELMEEMGLNVKSFRFLRSEFYEPSDTLMLNFEVYVDFHEMHMNAEEVDEAYICNINDVLNKIKPNSLAKKFVQLYLEEKNIS